MWELFKALGGTFNKSIEVCTTLRNMIAFAARELKLEKPFSYLAVTMIRKAPSKKAFMRLKAAEARYFLPILLHVLEYYFDSKGEHEQLRLQCGKALQRMYDELKNWCATSSFNLAHACRQHLILYQQLHLRSSSELMWVVLPKHHLLIHVCEGVTANPRDLWNYADEDEIGKSGKFGKNFTPNSVGPAVLRNFRLKHRV